MGNKELPQQLAIRLRKLQMSYVYIKKCLKSCQIIKHFIECFNDVDEPTKKLHFILIDFVGNTYQLSNKRIEEILLKKKNILDRNLTDFMISVE